MVKLPIIRQCKTFLNTHPHRTDCLKYPVYFVIPVSCIFLIHLLLCVYNQCRTVDRALAGNAFMYISHTQNLTTENIQSRGQQVSATAPCTLLLCIAKLNSPLMFKMLQSKCIWGRLCRTSFQTLLITLLSNGVPHLCPPSSKQGGKQIQTFASHTAYYSKKLNAETPGLMSK